MKLFLKTNKLRPCLTNPKIYAMRKGEKLRSAQLQLMKQISYLCSYGQGTKPADLINKKHIYM